MKTYKIKKGFSLKKKYSLKKRILGGNISAIPDNNKVSIIKDNNPAVSNVIDGGQCITKLTMFDFLSIESNHDHLLMYDDNLCYGHLKSMENYYNFDFTGSLLHESLGPIDFVKTGNKLSNHRGIGDSMVRGLMFNTTVDGISGVKSFSKTKFDIWKGPMNDNMTHHSSDWSIYEIPSLFTSNCKCFVKGFLHAAKTTAPIKEVFEKLDNSSSTDFKDYFFTNDAAGEFYNNLISSSDANTKKYRVNYMWSAVHECDQMTAPTYSSTLSRIHAMTPKSNFVISMYDDFKDYDINDTKIMIFKDNVKSQINRGVGSRDGKRTISFDNPFYKTKLNTILPSLRVNMNTQLDNTDTNDQKLIIGKTDAKTIAKQIKDYAKDNYAGTTLIAQIKRFGDYGQIDYSNYLQKYLAEEISTNNTNLINSGLTRNIYEIMSGTVNPTPPEYGYGKSDLYDRLISGISLSDKKKIMSKRIIHVTGDAAAFCWCVYTETNCIYYKKGKMLVCLIDRG